MQRVDKRNCPFSGRSQDSWDWLNRGRLALHQEAVLHWISGQKTRSPHVFMSHEVIFTIPGSEIDYELALSFVVLLSKNRRNRIGVSTIDEITSICHNLENPHSDLDNGQSLKIDKIIDSEMKEQMVGENIAE